MEIITMYFFYSVHKISKDGKNLVMMMMLTVLISISQSISLYTFEYFFNSLFSTFTDYFFILTLKIVWVKRSSFF